MKALILSGRVAILTRDPAGTLVRFTTVIWKSLRISWASARSPHTRTKQMACTESTRTSQSCPWSFPEAPQLHLCKKTRQEPFLGQMIKTHSLVYIAILELSCKNPITLSPTSVEHWRVGLPCLPGSRKLVEYWHPPWHHTNEDWTKPAIPKPKNLVSFIHLNKVFLVQTKCISGK